MEEKRQLKSGFTTGTCAAAAVMAAAQALAGGGKREYVSLMTPGGREAAFEVLWQPECGEKAGGGQDGFWPGSESPEKQICMVRKDSGDDPDVTNGTLIGAAVSFGENVQRAEESGEELPGIYSDHSQSPSVYLTGGIGVGRVTKKGLKCPVGYPAINPVPRQMIAEAARTALWNLGCERPVYIEIFIPSGRELALKTFNPRLGIEGGISVLGTTGIVNPMSEQALIETIRLDIRVQAAENRTLLAVAPGNYGEAFLREEMGLSMDAFVKCSNFVGETFSMLREEGVRQALFAGHLGKLIKVAGGVMNTHSKYGDRRMEILADCLAETWNSEEKRSGRFALNRRREEVIGQILSMNTTDQAAEFLSAQGLLASVMKTVTGRIKSVLESRFQIETEVIVFSGSAGILGMTAGAEAFAKRLKGRI
jgi:cobalt-precorrin-5B (C1)-methyltransferase